MKKLNLLTLVTVLVCSLGKTWANDFFNSLDELKNSNKYPCLSEILNFIYSKPTVITKSISIDDVGNVVVVNNTQIRRASSSKTNTLVVSYVDVNNYINNVCKKTNYEGLNEFEKNLFNYYKFDQNKKVTIIGLMQDISLKSPLDHTVFPEAINGSISVDGEVKDIRWEFVSYTQPNSWTLPHEMNYRLLDKNDSSFQIATAVVNRIKGTVVYTYMGKDSKEN